VGLAGGMTGVGALTRFVSCCTSARRSAIIVSCSAIMASCSWTYGRYTFPPLLHACVQHQATCLVLDSGVLYSRGWCGGMAGIGAWAYSVRQSLHLPTSLCQHRILLRDYHVLLLDLRPLHQFPLLHACTQHRAICLVVNSGILYSRIGA
jgi:hypothetical protein